MSDPLVSVIIPAYNRATYLTEAIDSCLAQSWPQVEVLVVDDGSTDATPELLGRYAAEQAPERFRWCSQENQGQNAARNQGVGMARGKYLKFLDSDDALDAEALRHVVAAMETSGADVCLNARCYMTEEGRVWPGTIYQPPAGVLDRPLARFFNVEGIRYQTSLWTFGRQLFDQGLTWDPKLVAMTDVDLVGRALIEGARLTGAPEGITHQRCHSGVRERSRKFEVRGIESIQEMNRRFHELLETHGYTDELRMAFAGFLCRLTMRWWEAHRTAALACYQLAKEVQRRPCIVLSDNYPPAVRCGAAWIWRSGGPFLFVPAWRMYEKTKPLRRWWQTKARKRRRRREAQAAKRA